MTATVQSDQGSRQRTIVGLGFRIVGLVIGASSIIALAMLVPDIFALRHPVAKAHNLDIGTYGLVGLLQNAANGVVSVLGFFAPAAAWVLTIVAIFDAGVLVVAVVLYLTGGGIKRRAAWARIIGILASATVILVFLPGLIWALHGMRFDLAAIVLVPFGVSLYALWVLIWRFR